MGNARADVAHTADGGWRRETIAEPHCTLFNLKFAFQWRMLVPAFWRLPFNVMFLQCD
jgi:hypothetical protein